MKRKVFLQTMALLPLAGTAVYLSQLHRFTSSLRSTEKMPVLFLGHGSPMNAIEENEFARGWRIVAQSLPTPSAILCISAHWETKGTFVTAMEKPKTIHDFGGFPPALFAVQYPAPGSPDLARQTKEIITSAEIGLDQSWGLDHGCWSVIKRMYPDADIPVIQMSLDYQQGPQYHYDLARELAALRRKGVLILGSGNMVHNLGIMDWNRPTAGYDWAMEANTTMKNLMMEKDHQSMIRYSSLGKSFQLSIPTPEHYLPLLYVLGLQESEEKISFFNDRTVMGSISMTSVQIG